ncbi:AraC family transcriptional regulator ligand-binding domain-containing protein [Kordiimonas sp. SCSIO 12610]|nr:AraC family transcriptional regulator ligand-binding domain-containing protein [Kordiimonas sp. SCSIO 12610]
MLGVLGATDDAFLNPVFRFDCDRVIKMLAAAELETGCKSIGLEAGLNFTPATFGDVGYAGICSPTLVDAGKTNSKYESLNQQFGRTKVVVEEDTVRTYWHPNIEADNPEALRPIIEAVFTGLANVGRWLLWAFKEEAMAVHFRHQKPSTPDPYEEYFGCKVYYGQEVDFLEYKKGLAQKKLPQPNLELLEILKSRLDVALRNLEVDKLTTGKVRQCINHMLPTKAPKIEDVADMLNVSSKTLARRLSGEGTSFRDLLQDVRIQNYHFMKEEGGRSLSEIAHALGYSEQSSFTRAYRSWFGKAPTE